MAGVPECLKWQRGKDLNGPHQIFIGFDTYSSQICAFKCRKQFVVWAIVLGLNYPTIDWHFAPQTAESKHSSAEFG